MGRRIRAEGLGDLPQNSIEVSLVTEVKTNKDWKDFLGLNTQVYRPESSYCPPLDLHLKMMLGSLKQPEKHLLVAYQNALPVARMGIKRHRHGDYDALHFGFYESLPVGPEATIALFAEARKRYPELELRGPYQFRMEDPYTGILVDGFDQDPHFFMSYNPPYYDEYIKGAQMSTAMDLFTYEFKPGSVNLNSMEKKGQEAKDAGYTLRNLNMRKLGAEAKHMAKIFNDALSENWGYEKLEDDQINDLITLARVFLDPNLVFFSEYQGETVGCAIMLPNFNPIIKPTRGKLGPGFVWDFLTKRRKLDTFRCYAIGVLKEHRKSPVGGQLANALMQKFKTTPWKSIEMSWILSNNRPMNLMAIGLGGKRSKIYRVYESPAASKMV